MTVLRAGLIGALVLHLAAGAAEAGARRPGGAVPDQGMHPGRMKQYDRWQAMERRGVLAPPLSGRLRAEDLRTRRAVRDAARGSAALPRRGLPAVNAPAGVPPPPAGVMDTVLSQWVAHYSSGVSPSTDAAAAVTYDAAGNVYVAGYTTGIFSGSDFLTAKYSGTGVLLWSATYNGPGNDFDAATAIALDAAGNILVTGSSFGVDTEEDFATIKYSPLGQQMWVARYDGPAHDYDAAAGIKLDLAGNAHVTGVSYGLTTDADFATVKYSPSGQQMWAVRYNDTGNDFDAPVGLGVDLSGSVYVSGTAVGFDSYEDFVTVKYSFQGDQVWVARYNGPGRDYDAVAAMTVDISGNSYVTGASMNANFDTDFATVKYNAFGGQEWVARFSTPDEVDEIALAIAIDPSRNVYVTGTSFAFGSGEDYLTIKYSSSGGERWQARYNGTGNGFDEPRAITADAGGNVTVTGSSIGLDGTEDVATIRYSTLGATVWAMRYAGTSADYDAGAAVAVDASGNTYAAGVSYGTVTDEDLAVLKYSPTGAELWASRFNGPGNSSDEAVAVALDPSGNIIITGTSYDIVTQSDFATVKYSPAGVPLWEARYNGTGDGEDFASGLAVDGNGNVIVTGTSLGTLSGYDIVTVKYNALGAQQWVVRHSSTGNAIDEAVDAGVDASGNVYVGGVQYDPASGTNIVLLKYLANGSPSWTAAYDGTGAGLDRTADIAVDPAGAVLLTGSSEGSGTQEDIVTLRYTTSGTRQWVARYNGAGNGIDRGAAAAFEGSNAVVAGVTAGSGTGTDGVLLRYTSTGAQTWVRTVNSGGADNDQFSALVVAPSGALYAAGTARSTATAHDLLLVKYSSAGALQWTARYNSAENDDDVTTALSLDALEGVHVSGYSFLLNPGYDFLTVKYAADGTRLWVVRYDDPAQFNDEPRGVVVDRNGNIYVAGFSETEDGSVYTLVKYEAPRYVPSRTAIAFPSAGVGCRSTDTVIVRNPTSANPLIVTEARSTSPAFTVSPSAFRVAPGDSVRLAVRFAPLLAGSASGVILLTHNSITTPDSITVSGLGTGAGAAVLVSTAFTAGWQLVSLPVDVTCPFVIPFTYGFTGSYVRSDTLRTGRGYWTKLADSVMQFTGFPILLDTIPVSAGWNLIGSMSFRHRVGTIGSSPAGIIRTAFFGYNRGYFAADTILPAAGYWVKVSQDGLLFTGPPSLDAPATARPVPARGGRLLVEDAAGRRQELFLTGDVLREDVLEAGELPPPPPAGAFDVRFSTGRMTEDLRGLRSGGLRLLAQGAEPPLVVTWEPGASPVQGEIRTAAGERLPLDRPGRIESASTEPFLIQPGEGGAEVPVRTALVQNTPNPFNPATSIGFALAEPGWVDLEVFDLLGRRVAVLESGNRAAGMHRTEWNAGSAASGVYFYRLTVRSGGGSAVSHQETRRMVLLR